MASILQAAKWMRQKRRVYSSDSQRRQSLYLGEDENLYQHPSGIKVRLTIYDIEADDWELADEGKG